MIQLQAVAGQTDVLPVYSGAHFQSNVCTKLPPSAQTRATYTADATIKSMGKRRMVLVFCSLPMPNRHLSRAQLPKSDS